MKSILKTMLLFIMLIAFVSVSIASAQDGNGSKEENKKKSTKKIVIVYKPKVSIGVPGNREGAASRGPDDVPFLSALVPDHIGCSSVDQPTIYWFIEKTTTQKIYFKLHLEPAPGQTIDDLYEDDEEDAPANEVSKKKGFGFVFQTEVDCSKLSGIVGLSLKKYGVKLLPGRVYKWSVSGEVTDSDSKSNDKKAFGKIQFIAPTTKEKQEFEKAKGLDKIQALASNGMWYDTLSEFSKLIRDNPGDKELLSYRAAMLDQVGLTVTVSKLKEK